MIPIIMIRAKRLIAWAIGLFGLWLVYWNTVEATTILVNTGVWKPELITVGIPSIVLGIIIIFIAILIGHVKVVG